MINILISDDHKMFIGRLKSMLGAKEGMHVVRVAYNGKEGLERLKQY